MSFTFSPAVRDRVGLLISIAGGTGSGKSMSGLRVARGLAAKPGEDLTDPDTLAKVDARVAGVDTEAGRLKHYAPAPGEKPGAFTFGFQHGDMKPPFSPAAYMGAISEIDRLGFEVALVDSFSHEWAGEGGVSDMQEEALSAAVERAAEAHKRENRNYPFDEDKTRERLSMACWKGPKMEHKRLVSRLLQTRCHVIVCLRAEERIKMEQVEEEGSNGRKYKKTVITQPTLMPVHERWSPVCEKKLPFEFSVSILLTMDRPGYPIPLKLEEQHKAAVPLDRPLSELTGQMLAAWARGGASGADPILESLIATGNEKAAAGVEALKTFWTSLSRPHQHALKAKLVEWKSISESAKPAA